MNFARSHRRLIASILYGFVLLNGLLCSLGHGQMLAPGQASSWAAAPLSADDICGLDDSATQAPDGADHGSHGVLSQLAMFECAFAGQVTAALLLLGGLVWLLHAHQARPRATQFVMPFASRHDSPGLAPQAP